MSAETDCGEANLRDGSQPRNQFGFGEISIPLALDLQLRANKRNFYLARLKRSLFSRAMGEATPNSYLNEVVQSVLRARLIEKHTINSLLEQAVAVQQIRGCGFEIATLHRIFRRDCRCLDHIRS